ncbi:NADP-dependent 3-hydroxy acid dehydrogenase YdfG [Albimonas donghaensis]|uniref:NADP-dependent 3-hydroxy acid dehydrogenase YdfG n=1 Tax=Albimonas donghaensis TaxID=356660 RepID=A0A1H2RDT9_9RHOB|nr:SDR family NAD(P)-dependent oxidoreductase [Albimonas donghaensis]SDW17475.1 NADP-dependent 3-hydroxy acid dehydrogenase YdfG [Albimonas donghaensis]
MRPKTILITGCSSGIGLDAARALHRAGWRVFATCRRQVDCDRLQAEGLESFPLDYADEASVARAAAETLRRAGGTLDALFNNGAYAIPAPLEDVPRDAMRAIFETNVLGWHDLTRRLLPALRASGDGRVVNCSSVLGMVSLRYRGPYNATKFAIEGMTDCLRRECDAPEAPGPRVRVILIEPGPIRTAFRRNARARMEAAVDRSGSAWGRAWAEKILPRLEAPETETLDRFELMPEAVTARLTHALTAHRPKARYYVTTPTWIAALAARLLPTRALDFVFRGDH